MASCGVFTNISLSSCQIISFYMLIHAIIFEHAFQEFLRIEACVELFTSTTQMNDGLWYAFISESCWGPFHIDHFINEYNLKLTNGFIVALNSCRQLRHKQVSDSAVKTINVNTSIRCVQVWYIRVRRRWLRPTNLDMIVVNVWSMILTYIAWSNNQWQHIIQSHHQFAWHLNDIEHTMQYTKTCCYHTSRLIGLPDIVYLNRV